MNKWKDKVVGLPWGTITFLLLVVGGLYALYPSNAGGETPDTVSALLYAVGIVIAVGTIIICWFLFRPAKNYEKEKPAIAPPVNVQVGTQKPPPKENYFAEQVAAMAVLVAGLFFWGAIPYEAIPPVPPEGMLYIPIWGLLKAAMVAGLITILWSFFCDTKTTNGAIFAVILFFGAMEGVFFLGISRYWFAPLSSDPLVDAGLVLGGVIGMLIFIQALTKNIEYSTIALLVAIAVWLPQMAAKSPGLMGFAHALFR